MMNICPNCGRVNTQYEIISKKYYFRGDYFCIDVKIEKCSKCGEIIERENESQIIKKIFNLYIAKYNLISSEEIKAIRSSNKMTPIQFDKVLGCTVGLTAAVEKGIDLYPKEIYLKIKNINKST